MENEKTTPTPTPGHPAAKPAPKPAWRAPVITRIPLNRTMTAGSF